MKAWTLILVNPKAREGEVGRRWPSLQKELMAALGEESTQVAFTSEQDLGSGRVRAALKDGADRVVVVGGDGTLSEAMQGFFEDGRAVAPGASLGIVPAGRGDDFFKSIAGWDPLSGKSSFERALELLKKGAPKPTDVGVVQWLGSEGAKLGRPRYFINIASVGYPALVVQRVLARKGWIARSKVGKSAWAYIAHSAAAMKEYKPVDVTVSADGDEVYRGPLFSGFLLNGVYNGGGVRWSNEASVDDGKLHVLALEPQGLVAQLTGGGKMLSGKWAGAKGAHVGAGRVIEVMQTSPGEDRSHPLFELDGDLPEPPGTMGARVECLPGAIRVWR